LRISRQHRCQLIDRKARPPAPGETADRGLPATREGTRVRCRYDLRRIVPAADGDTRLAVPGGTAERTLPQRWVLAVCSLATGGWLSSAALGDDQNAVAVSAPQPTKSLPEIVIVGTTPLAGSGIDMSKVPSNVQTMTGDELSRDPAARSIAGAAASRLSSVSLRDEQGSVYQPDFLYRGFEASPTSGIAEGLAVYQNGTRVNEAFGDNVNWDLIPTFAVSRLTVQGNSPVFGLNALGGAVTIDMKNAFNTTESGAQISAGSYGNLSGYAEYAARDGELGIYAAAGGAQDGGFRYQSPTYVQQGYLDVGHETSRTTLHATLALANDRLGAAGPTPIELLGQNPRSVFTTPQATRNEAQLAQAIATTRVGASVLLSGSVYFRHFHQDLTDGNTTNVQTCGNAADFFCLGGQSLYPRDLLYDTQGQPVPTSVLPRGSTPGETDFVTTDTHSAGAALQAAIRAPLAGHDNQLVAGASVDRSTTNYSAHGELGQLEPSLTVTGTGVVIDQSMSASAEPPLESPVAVRAMTTYYGLYGTEAFDISKAVTWTLSARFNSAQISLRDQLGAALNGDHAYSRFNPGSGLTVQLAPELAVYLGYSESNRAPTAGELNCANPAEPCLIDAFLLSDPELRQVVAHTFETGARGRFGAASGIWSWSAGLFRTDNSNDIILLATNVNGFGYFANAGTTRRQGIELALSYRDALWDFSVNYTLLDATYRDSLVLTSNSPAAVAGKIAVQPGDRLPGIPRQRITMQAERSFVTGWSAGLDVRAASSQYLVGDESNQEPALPGYGVVDLHGAYAVGKRWRVFAAIENVLDKTYYTYGAFANLDGLPPNVVLTNPRTYTPAPGRTFYAGVQLEF
jgi:iron complex outermembrane recepter protein